MARAAMGRLAKIPPSDDAALLELRNGLLNAQTKESRAMCAERLADAGDVRAIPWLRLSYAGDISGEVRESAGRALGRLGDAESVDSFVVALEQRDRDHERARTAAYALGYLGDIRGLHALISAYEAAWMPQVVSESIAAIGPAGIPALLQLVEERPQLLKRTTASTVFDDLKGDVLLPAMLERVEAIAQAADFIPRATALMELVKTRSPLDRQLGARILELRPDLVDGSREARALAKKSGARVGS
jgi:HEAT repeat protein